MRALRINANLLDLVVQLKREVQVGFEQVAERLAGDPQRQAPPILRLVQAQRLLGQPTLRLGDVLEAERLLGEVAADLAQGEAVADRLRRPAGYGSHQRRYDRWSVWGGPRRSPLAQRLGVTGGA